MRLTKEYILELSNDADVVERCLIRMWLDADRGLWPKQNYEQQKILVESAIRKYLDMKEVVVL